MFYCTVVKFGVGKTDTFIKYEQDRKVECTRPRGIDNVTIKLYLMASSPLFID